MSGTRNHNDVVVAWRHLKSNDAIKFCSHVELAISPTFSNKEAPFESKKRWMKRCSQRHVWDRDETATNCVPFTKRPQYFLSLKPTGILMHVVWNAVKGLAIKIFFFLLPKARRLSHASETVFSFYNEIMIIHRVLEIHWEFQPPHTRRPTRKSTNWRSPHSWRYNFAS